MRQISTLKRSGVTFQISCHSRVTFQVSCHSGPLDASPRPGTCGLVPMRSVLDQDRVAAASFAMSLA